MLSSLNEAADRIGIRSSHSSTGCLRKTTTACALLGKLSLAKFLSCHGVSTALDSRNNVGAVLGANLRHAHGRVTERSVTSGALINNGVGCHRRN